MEESSELQPEENKVSAEKFPKRKLKTPAQLKGLEKFYTEHKYPTEELKLAIAEELELTEKQVSGWFCHRRLKDKRLLKEEANANGRQDRSSGVIQDRGSGLGQDSCGSSKHGDYKYLDPKEVESNGLYNRDLSVADMTYGRRNHFSENVSGMDDDTSSESSSYLQERMYPQGQDPYEMEPSRYSKALPPLNPKGAINMGYKPSGYLKVKGEIEHAAITAVKKQLGRNYQEDGPLLGVEFDPLPPGAFECQEKKKQNQNMSLHSSLIVEETKQNKEEERRKLVEEVKTQLWLSGPLISVTLLNFGISLISLMFVGHLSELSLSGASMATSFASVTGFSLLVGMASALDTLCGQSYGAKQYRMLGIHMQRAMFILMIVAIPLAIIWANTRSILIFLGQDHEISTEAGNYAKLMVPSLFAYGLLQCLNRFLQTQNIVFPMMLSSAVTTLLHLPLCWYMVYKSGFGSGGAAIASSISYWVNVIILSLYVKFSPSCQKTWNGFSREALAPNNIPIFLKLAIPSAAMVCLEIWSFELVVLLSGLLPNPKLETSVLSICLNTTAVVWMIPFGLSGAISVRVSNELGAGNPQAARLAVCVVVVIAVIESILVGAVVILIRNIWGYAYSNEEEVVKYVANMMPLLAVTALVDGMTAVLSGTARGCGWQKICAFVNLGSYYLVGIPAAVVLAFVLHIGGKGLWLGIICALIVHVLCLTIITIRTDWEKEAKKATHRVYNAITTEILVA